MSLSPTSQTFPQTVLPEETAFSSTTASCCCCAIRQESTSMTSDFENLISMGIAQYDTTEESKYPFIETTLHFNPPELEDAEIARQVSGKEGKFRWIPLAYRTKESFSQEDQARIEKWMAIIKPLVTSREETRSERLQSLSPEAYATVKHLDFCGMKMPISAIIERINKAQAPTIINLKNCQFSDQDFSRIQLKPSLQKLILSYNPLTDVAVAAIKQANLHNLDVVCLAHTKVAKDFAEQTLSNGKTQVFL